MNRNMNPSKIIAKTIIIEGDKVQNIGYRPFLFAKALRLRIPNFDVENIEENGKQKVIVSIKGEDKQISDFVAFVNTKRPENAEVDSILDDILIGDEDVISIEEYGKILNVEQTNNIVQGGQKIDKKLDTGFGMLGEKVDSLRKETTAFRTETNENFKHMDLKYELISKGMFDLVDTIEKRNQAFEKRLEKTDKNIEELLKILTDQI